MNEIFDSIDNAQLKLAGFDLLGFIKNHSTWRKYVLLLTLASAACWVIFGWEGTWTQLCDVIFNLPQLISGNLTFQQYQDIITSHYGLGQHFSSALFYGVTFVILSLHLERLGFKKSRNFMLTLTLTLMSVGFYELIYNLLYGSCQNQPWVMSFSWKQGANLFAFTVFALSGLASTAYLLSYGLKPNLNKTTAILALLTLASYAAWIFYPFQTATLTVQTTTGEWNSTPFFPQTMYAVDPDPLDGVAVGDQYFVENNLLHFVNVINKFLFTLFLLSFCLFNKHF